MSCTSYDSEYKFALAHKNIDYDYKAVNLLKGEQKTEYLSINAVGYVPSLKVNEGIINESVAILDYLEDFYSDKPKLLPTNPFERAKVRSIVQQICCGIQPIQNLSVLKQLNALGLSTEVSNKWAHDVIAKGFAALEKTLVETAGKCCFGDELTQADCCLVPQVFNANRFKVDLSLYPTIVRVHDHLSGLQAVKNSHPTKMPDCPEEQRP